MTELMEKFSWMSPEHRMVDTGKNTVKIKGIALRTNAISKNQRHYVDEELTKSARTWIGKPVTINHDAAKNVGTVEWMEHDIDGNLEYVAVVNKQPYVDMVRMYGRNPKESSIKGVSVEGNYLHNICPECKKRGVEKRFYTEQDFHNHMHTEHFIKTNPVTEPHGLVGQALSLVIAPEVPGVEGTTIQVMETVQNDEKRLFETIARIGEEKETMTEKLKGKVATTNESRIAAPMVLTAKTVEGDMNILPSTTVLVETNVPFPSTTTPAKTENPPLPKAKEADYPWDQCVSDRLADGYDEDSAKKICAAIKNRTVSRTVEVTLPTGNVPLLNLTEFAKPPIPKLRLGEPFADYSDFNDCVAKNSDKDNPEAYCATIKRQTEGETARWNKTVELAQTVQKLAENANVEKKIQFTLPADDLTWKEMIQGLPRDDVSWKEEIKKLPPDDTSWKETFVETKKLLETFKAEMLVIKGEFDKKLTEAEAKITAGDTQTLAKFEEAKKGFEKLLELADQNVLKADSEIKTLKTRLEENEAKKLKETENLAAQVAEVKKDQENTEQKLEKLAAFKGHASSGKKQAESGYTVDPAKVTKQ